MIERPTIRASAFGFLSDFDIRHSEFISPLPCPRIVFEQIADEAEALVNRAADFFHAHTCEAQQDAFVQRAGGEN